MEMPRRLLFAFQETRLSKNMRKQLNGHSHGRSMVDRVQEKLFQTEHLTTALPLEAIRISSLSISIPLSISTRSKWGIYARAKRIWLTKQL
uniref:Uncharacterized protein n=1 Tax=Steinernema glaseri TaxID=37863 RepID=A0A1I8A5F5_9BILA